MCYITKKAARTSERERERVMNRSEEAIAQIKSVSDKHPSSIDRWFDQYSSSLSCVDEATTPTDNFTISILAPWSLVLPSIISDNKIDYLMSGLRRVDKNSPNRRRSQLNYSEGSGYESRSLDRFVLISFTAKLDKWLSNRDFEQKTKEWNTRNIFVWFRLLFSPVHMRAKNENCYWWNIHKAKEKRNEVRTEVHEQHLLV